MKKAIIDCSKPVGEQEVIVDLTQAEIDAANQSYLASQAEALKQQALSALDKSGITLDRIDEAVSLGLTTLTAPDVVEFMQYRRNLRAVVRGESAVLPSHPTNADGSIKYPVGT